MEQPDQCPGNHNGHDGHESYSGPQEFCNQWRPAATGAKRIDGGSIRIGGAGISISAGDIVCYRRDLVVAEKMCEPGHVSQLGANGSIHAVENDHYQIADTGRAGCRVVKNGREHMVPGARSVDAMAGCTGAIEQRASVRVIEVLAAAKGSDILLGPSPGIARLEAVCVLRGLQ